MNKVVQVHMLPTGKIVAPEIPHYIHALSLHVSQRPRGGSSLSYDRYLDNVEVPNPQHLYFTTDERIKPGDFLIANNEIVLQFIGGIGQDFCTLEGEHYKGNVKGRKIVATTNPFLLVRGEDTALMSEEELEDFFIRAEIGKIPKSFINIYIETYNTGTCIKEVMLEYVDNGYEVDMEGRGGEDIGWMPKMQLKLRSDDSVVWGLKEEERIYTREDVRRIVAKYIQFGSEELFDQWFDKNYQV